MGEGVCDVSVNAHIVGVENDEGDKVRIGREFYVGDVPVRVTITYH